MRTSCTVVSFCGGNIDRRSESEDNHLYLYVEQLLGDQIAHSHSRDSPEGVKTHAFITC